MARFTKIDLGELMIDAPPEMMIGNKLSTKILNDQGNLVGRFSTHGVGMTEHNRRLNSVLKRTISRRRKDD